MDTELKTREQPATDRPAEPRSSKVAAIECAAVRLFHERGYGDVSMDEVARAAGVSKATIYAHFADKAELFASMMRAGCSMAWIRDELAERPVGDVRACLTEVAFAYATALAENAPISRIVVAESRRFPEIAELFYNHGPRASRAALKSYLDRACAAGKLAIPDTELAASQFFALQRDDTYLHQLLSLPQENGPERQAASLKAGVEMFLKAYAVG